ncbi:MAG TPA: hypothetical protein VNG32_00490 [Candidatus Dormibacteraeota bacterium]|nr:hypothetical protein [Candidatus Dormibacteraeota bacterium]
MLLGKWKYGTTWIEILASDDFTDHLRKDVRDKGWQTFMVDTDPTQEWRKAEAIACKHFDTKNYTLEHEKQSN